MAPRATFSSFWHIDIHKAELETELEAELETELETELEMLLLS